MAKYLYGSSVQRIQSLIFETGKLKEIVGASELVEQICTTKFQEAVGPGFNEENVILGAAGKIIYLFDDRGECERVVYDFHKNILVEAPGTALTQALVKVEGDLSYTHLQELERRLEIQKNRKPTPHGLGLMISERSRRTGGAGLVFDGEIMDRRQKAKHRLTRSNRESLFKKLLGEDHQFNERDFPRGDMNELVRDEESGWLAVVHADGNGLGKLIQEVGQKVAEDQPGKLDEVMKEFSVNLDAATRSAAKEAFQITVQPVFEEERRKIPLRPILLGGDDLTLIIRGELALSYTAVFLERFTRYTKSNFSLLAKEYQLPMLSDGLNACAGIAYIKSKFPFHYGVNLAGSLCHYAKKTAKSLSSSSAPSCLAFHRVQSSFVENYDKIVEEELTAADGSSVVRFNYGPYFLEEKPRYATVHQLRSWVKAVNRPNAPKAGLRNWLTELHTNQFGAGQLMDRIKRLNRKYVSRLGLDQPVIHRANDNGGESVTHIYDMLALASIEKNSKP